MWCCPELCRAVEVDLVLSDDDDDQDDFHDEVDDDDEDDIVQHYVG